MALNQSYYNLWFESYKLKNTSGHTSEIQLKLVPDQSVPKEMAEECACRHADPFGLLTECSKKLFNNYPIGTKFHLKAKLTDREGEGLFFYNYYGWKPIQIVAPEQK